MQRNQLFTFGAIEIRTLTGSDGEPWFVARDVALALGYKRPNDAVRELCRKVQYVEGGDLPYSSNGGALSHNDKVRRRQIIPESDLYRLVIRSNLPSAVKFSDWVVDEVLPSIRKRGHYTLAGGDLWAWTHVPFIGYRTLMETYGRTFGKRKAVPSAAEISLLSASNASSKLGGLPPQYVGIAPDPEAYRVTADMALRLVGVVKFKKFGHPDRAENWIKQQVKALQEAGPDSLLAKEAQALVQ